MTTNGEARPVAWACTDFDGNVGVGVSKEEAKRQAGESCTEFFGLYSAADYEALRTELEVSDRNLVDAMSVIAKFDELQEAVEGIIFACDAHECDVVPFNKHRGGIRRLRSALKALNEAGEG